ncbi:TetR/AcrR family transcriptional regulator [Streptomyces sp. NPDC047061]|uniref:TetR/AcrR family transcriptional regulator n=1 Tax=Streptomyces sp. NPDC047061 TaxID=3154605 RepID=UPI0033D542C4
MPTTPLTQPAPPNGRDLRAAQKRAAILTSARELFVNRGVDHVSMDAVAAGAQVSKATLYSHFGSKRLLFEAILADVSEAMLAASDEALRLRIDEADIRTLGQLEQALVHLASDLSAMMMGSQGYGGFLTLVNQRRWQSGAPADEVSAEPVARVLAARFDRFVAAGLLDIEDTRTAAFQFGALTLLLVEDDQLDPRNVAEDRLHRVVEAGVRTFIRAFGVSAR